jgi:putative hydrolase of the HAD superfamily
MFDTILLDLGGVIIDVDYHRTARAFNERGFQRFEELYSKAQQDHLFDGFELGALSPAEFRARIRTLSNCPITDTDIDACWNAMLGHIPQERLGLVAQLKQRYRLLLLSNTNAIHVPAFTEIARRENAIADFKGLFHGAYYSCELGLRKPHPEAFDQVLGLHGASAATTLFIDDSIQHVRGARSAGLQAEHLELEREDLAALVGRLGLLG